MTPIISLHVWSWNHEKKTWLDGNIDRFKPGRSTSLDKNPTGYMSQSYALY